MALSDRDYPRLLSPPCKVIFAGFETTTTRLQQAGWELSAEQDMNRRRVRLAMRFNPARLYMVSEAQDFDFFHAVGRGSGNYGMEGYGGNLPVFHTVHCATDIRVQMMDDFSLFRPIDAAPQMVMSKFQSIEDFNLFATPLVRTEEIIVEPETVATLMEQIKKLQAPDLEAIRKRRRYQEGSSAPMPQTNFHAQILSLAA